MRAVVFERYGPPEVLRLEDVEPSAPKEDEVLVRVRATTVNRTDTGVRQGQPFFSRFISGFPQPRWKIPRDRVAGEIEATGPAVTECKVGDQVFGVNAWRFGAHAEFVCIRKGAALAHKPVSRSFELREGKTTLVYGASGSIGTAGVQLAKYYGADVTALCDTKNLELVRSLGADQVIDYTQEDFTTNGQTYDVIFDAVGMHSFRRSKGSLNPGGMYLATDHLQNLALALWTSRVDDKKVVFPIPPQYTKKDVLFLKQLIEAGKYRAVIDRCYPLEQVIDATRYVETEQKAGNVVLTINSGRTRSEPISHNT
jgi:NADPH:quinone reductase-like Zn-dependent oxidoreductase